MEKISKDSFYEILYNKYNPVYPQWVQSNEIVKKFIIDNNLIVYGGTAIDLALRLKGSKLYDDESLPVMDLDFYSATHAESAYNLADILYEAGYKEARVINGKHYSTMRVDIKDNTWVADISFCPQKLLDKIPTFLFQGMRFVAPEYQYMDVHRLLSMPYEDAPQENIFNRAKKDIVRFNMLYDLYPIVLKDSSTTEIKLHDVIANPKYVLHGFSAYSVIYHVFSALLSKMNSPEIIKHGSSIKGEKIILKSPDKKLIIVHINPAKLELPKNATKYQPLASMISAKIETDDMSIYVAENELIAINDVIIFGKILRICNIHFVMRWFLSMEYDDRYEIKTKKYYLSLLKMINLIEAAYDSFSEADKKRAEIFFPSINVYGVRNKTPSQQLFENKVNATIYGDKILYTSPVHYYPDRKKGHTVFDYDSSPFFQLNGDIIT
jgi:hypothetical protein